MKRKVWFTSRPVKVGRHQWRIEIYFDSYTEVNRIRFQFLDTSGRYAAGTWLDESAFPRSVPKGAFKLLSLNQTKVDNLCPWL